MSVWVNQIFITANAPSVRVGVVIDGESQHASTDMDFIFKGDDALTESVNNLIVDFCTFATPRWARS